MSFRPTSEVELYSKRKRARIHATMTCQYRNDTEFPQVVCISNVEGEVFERTVLPYANLLFETVPEAVLEVRSSAQQIATVIERIPCLRLRAIAACSIWPSCPIGL